MKRSFLSALFACLVAIVAHAQDISVHGTVLSRQDGEPLIGATVMSEATGKGVATDIDGNFEITVPGKSKLTVSYVGYNPTTVRLYSMRLLSSVIRRFARPTSPVRSP